MDGMVFIILFWLGVGIIGYGASYAYLQREYPTSADGFRTSDRVFSVFAAVCGPIGLLSLILMWLGRGKKIFKHGLLY